MLETNLAKNNSFFIFQINVTFSILANKRIGTNSFYKQAKLGENKHGKHKDIA